MSFEDELRKIFIEEVIQLIQDAEQCFLSLESTPGDPELIDKIFRVAHNIKGGAKAIGFNDLGVFAHEFESYLLKVKNKEIPIDATVINFMLKCNDQIKYMVDNSKSDAGARFDNTVLIAEIKERLKNIGVKPNESIQITNQTIVEHTTPAAAAITNEATVAEQMPTLTPDPTSIDFQISIDEIAILNQAETHDHDISVSELASRVQAQAQQFEQQIQDIQEMQVPTQVQQSAQIEQSPSVNATSSKAITIDESIRVSTTRLEKLLNYIGEMVILQSVLNEQSLGNNPHLLRRTIQEMSKITKEVQDISMSLRMIPLKQTFQKMQRIARDTSNYLNKKVQLKPVGEDTEVDKTVLENLSDPLVHVIRNAVDHGIESPEKRMLVGKPEMGTISLSAYHQSGKLVIEISDDGGGINPDILTQKAIEKGIFPVGTVLSRKDGINLIFHPGFSSKAEVTEISGRGVGMDVVRSNIEKMNGVVLVETELGKGTTFKIVLPLTLAIVEGMIIVSDKCRYVVPLAHVAETVRVNSNDFKKTSTLGDILLLRGENLPLFQLSLLLGKKPQDYYSEDGIALIIRNDDKSFAVVIDDILSQQQIVIKKLGNELRNIQGFSGSSILGDGRPALILELVDLIQQFEIKNSLNLNSDTRRVSA